MSEGRAGRWGVAGRGEGPGRRDAGRRGRAGKGAGGCGLHLLRGLRGWRAGPSCTSRVRQGVAALLGPPGGRRAGPRSRGASGGEEGGPGVEEQREEEGGRMEAAGATSRWGRDGVGERSMGARRVFAAGWPSAAAGESL